MGIEAGIAAITDLIGTAVAGEAAAAPFEAAGAMGAGEAAAGAVGAGEAAAGFGLPTAGGLGEMVAVGAPGLAPTAATGAGMGLEGLMGATMASGLGPEAIGMGGLASSAVGASDVLGAGFGSTANALGTGAFQPQGAVPGGTPDVWASPVAGQAGGASAGPGASAFAPAPGVTAGTGTFPDVTAAAAGGGGTPTWPAAGSTAGTGAGLPTQGGLGQMASVGAQTPSVGAGGSGNFLDNLGLGKIGEGAMKSITSNPLGIGLGAAGLGYNIMQGQKLSDAQKALTSQAADLSGQGAQMRSYLASGTLPAGLQASVDKAVSAAKANAIANAAAQGLPTDPTRNTALATTLADIDAKAPALIAQLGEQLMTTGVQESGLSSQLYSTLAQIDQTQTTNMGKAIANFAAAMSPGGTRIQIGGSSA
jgi:hypothetical protein